MCELDVADLTKMSELAGGGNGSYSGTAGLATLMVLSSRPPWLTRTKARYELIMQAGRDPELAVIVDDIAVRFHELVKQAVAQWQTTDVGPDPALVEEQTFAVLRFIEGVMIGFCRDSQVDLGAEQIDRLIQAIIAGVHDHSPKPASIPGGPPE
jgi:hypothetical protein